MDLGSTVSSVGTVLFVVGLPAAIWGGMFAENKSIRDIGALLAIIGVGVMASGVLLF